jgi:hypothetical protein
VKGATCPRLKMNGKIGIFIPELLAKDRVSPRTFASANLVFKLFFFASSYLTPTRYHTLRERHQRGALLTVDFRQPRALVTLWFEL